MDERILRLSADFNGIFGKVLCVSHRETCRDELGNPVEVRPGQRAIVFDLEADGRADDLVATGTMAHAPGELQHLGSRWVLLIDEHGVRDRSDLGPE